MSTSEFGLEVRDIHEGSTIPELIELLRSSFLEKEFRFVERILTNREEEFKRQMKKEQKDRALLQKIHGESELDKLELEEENKRLKAENLEMQEELKKLKREKQEAEETAQHLSQQFPEYDERIRHLEKAVASKLGIDVSEIGTFSDCNSSAANDLQKEGNSNLECKQTVDNASNHCEKTQTSCGAQSPRNGPLFEINSSHQERRSCNDGTLERGKDLFSGHSNAEIGIEDVCGASKVEVNGSQKNKNDSSYAAASTSFNRICNTGFHVKEQMVIEKCNQVIPSSDPVSDRSQSPIIVEIIESDDETSGDVKPFVPNACSSEVNSSKKEVTFPESRSSACPTQMENGIKRTAVSNPLKNLPPNRKRRLTLSDDSDTYPVGKEKAKTVTELPDDGKDSIVNTCSVKLDSATTGSQSILPSAIVQMVKERYQEKAGADCSLPTVSRTGFDCTDDSDDDSSTDSGDIKDMIEELRQDSRKRQRA